jgi:O-succinylbenzoate synthase
MIALLALLACDPPVVEATETERLQFGSISGVIQRSAPLWGDGSGALIVGLFQYNKWGVEGKVYRGWGSLMTSVAADDVAIAYEITNVFPQEGAYYLAALWDEDFSSLTDDLWTITEGDITSAASPDNLEPIWLGSGEHIELDLDLAFSAPED